MNQLISNINSLGQNKCFWRFDGPLKNPLLRALRYWKAIRRRNLFLTELLSSPSGNAPEFMRMGPQLIRCKRAD